MLKILQQKIPFPYLFLLFLVFSLVFIWLNQTLFFKEPAVWPDEVIFSNNASNYLDTGWLNSHLIKGLTPEVGNDKAVHPFYIWSLIFWFKLFGVSISSQRLLSFVFGIGVIFIFYKLQKLLLKNNLNGLSFLVLGIFAFDFTFNKALRVGRPEIEVIFFLLSAFYLFLKFPSRIGMFGSGFFMGLASVTHPVGFLGPTAIFLYLILTQKFHIFSEKVNYYFLFAYCFPLFLWFLYVWPDFGFWQSQLLRATLNKEIETPWIILVFKNQPLLMKLLYVFYLLVSAIYLLFSKKEKSSLLLCCLLLTTWVFVTFGKMFWYFGLLIPFLYLCLSVLLHESFNNQKRFLLSFGLLIIGLVPNLFLQNTLLNSFSGNKYSYEKFGQQILKLVPDNKTVFISSVPDPYYAFKENHRNNYLYQFPSVYISESIFYKMLNDSDYIIYTGSLNPIVFGDFLEKYLQKNQKNIIPVGSPNQYSAQVVELIPKEQRVKIN